MKLLTVSILSILLFGCANSILNIAKHHIEQRDFKKAELELENILQTDSTNAEVYYWLGFIKCEENNIDEMLYYFEKCSSYDTFHFTKEIDNCKKYTWGKIFNAFVNSYEEEDYERAIELYKKLLKLETGNSTKQNHLEELKKKLREKKEKL